MKTKLLLIIIIVIVAIGAVYWLRPESSPEKELNISNKLTINYMNLTSSVFNQNEKISSKYTCDGENVSPPLSISDVPENAKSLALISDDPDAPAGTWVHWTVWNIASDAKEIAENSVPVGAVLGITSFGNKGYGGPCPPSGTHRYFFKLYALDTVLNLNESADVKTVETAMEGHILSKAELMGTYSRK